MNKSYLGCVQRQLTFHILPTTDVIRLPSVRSRIRRAWSQSSTHGDGHVCKLACCTAVKWPSLGLLSDKKVYERVFSYCSLHRIRCCVLSWHECTFDGKLTKIERQLWNKQLCTHTTTRSTNAATNQTQGQPLATSSMSTHTHMHSDMQPVLQPTSTAACNCRNPASQHVRPTQHQLMLHKMQTHDAAHAELPV